MRMRRTSKLRQNRRILCNRGWGVLRCRRESRVDAICDIVVTQKLIDAGKLVNVPLLDHVIMGSPSENHSGFFSIAASGLLEFCDG